jgi:hypothetical protein
MLGNQLMMCNINQQVLLDEALDPRLRRDSRDNLERSWGNANTRDEDTGVKVAGSEMLGESAHLLDSYRRVGQEFHPNCADIWGGGIRIAGRDGVRVFLHHSVAGASGEAHSFAAGQYMC